MATQKKKCKCIDCGYLEPHCDPGEATPELRNSMQNKEIIGGMDVTEYLKCNYLVCHRRALSEYITKLETIIDERSCKYFYLYKQGYAPAQHLQMQDTEIRDKLNWHKNMITAAIFTTLGAALTLLIMWLTGQIGK